MKTLLQIGATALLLSSSITTSAVSMGQMIGQVTVKESGEPLAQTEIIFENKWDKIIIQTDEHGYYYSNHMPTGRYTISIRFNNRTFVMNRVRVYDSYTSEVNFKVSSNDELPEVVEVRQQFPMTSSVETTDIRLTDETSPQTTRTLSEALSNFAGVDVINGQVYINGSLARFFIDGSPVIGPTTLSRIW